jgi:hypothetical protein
MTKNHEAVNPYEPPKLDDSRQMGDGAVHLSRLWAGYGQPSTVYMLWPVRFLRDLDQSANSEFGN